MADGAKTRRTGLKSKLTRMIRRLNESIEDNYPSSEIKSIFDQLTDLTEELEKAHDNYLQTLGDNASEQDFAWIKPEIARVREVKKKAMQKRSTAAPVLQSKVKMKPLDYPVFDGDERKFKEWKREYTDVIRPRLSGSSDAEVTLCLKNCLSKKVKDKLAPDCRTEDGILKELERKYGATDRIVNRILEEVFDMPTPTNSPTQLAEFFRAILSAVNDLAELGSESCLKNPAVVMQLVRKLPPQTRERWWETLYSLDGTKLTESEKPEKFISFVKWQLNMADERAAVVTDNRKSASTKLSINPEHHTSETFLRDCSVCRDGSHPIWQCAKFRNMSPKDRNCKVIELKLCFKCLKGKHKASECKHVNPKLCRKCSKCHNFMLHVDDVVDKPKSRSQASQAAENVTTNHGSVRSSSQLMMVQYVYVSSGERVGMIWDNASDTNYCTNELAGRLKLSGEPFTLIINSIAGVKTRIETMRYIIHLKSNLGSVPITVYGVDEIAKISPVNVNCLLNFFPDFSCKTLERPSCCDLLLSQANANLMPTKFAAIDNLVLWRGPLGFVVSGSHRDLSETGTVKVKHLKLTWH